MSFEIEVRIISCLSSTESEPNAYPAVPPHPLAVATDGSGVGLVARETVRHSGRLSAEAAAVMGVCFGTPPTAPASDTRTAVMDAREGYGQG